MSSSPTENPGNQGNNPGSIPIHEIRGLQNILDTMVTQDTIAFGTRIVIPGLSNGGPGLDNWRYSWARMGKVIGGSGKGGSDVVFMGDSVLNGAFAANQLFDTMIPLLRNKLQAYFNPSGVQGGPGYIPIITNGATWTRTDDPVGSQSHWIWTPSNAASWTLGAGGTGLQVGMRRSYHQTNGNNSRARFVFDGTAANAAAKRMQVTDIELVTSKNVSDGILTWDSLTSDAFVAVGAGGSTGTIDGNATKNYGLHQGRQTTGLTASDVNGIQIGTASGTAICRPDGLIGYNGDWGCGCRVQNLAINGARTDYITTDAATLSACITKWGATAPGGTAAGATQAGLFVFGFYLNDVGLSATPTLTLAQFTANYESMIQTALACASKPSVLIFIAQVRNNANTLANYAPYVAALYELARGYNCAVLDMNSFWGNVNYTSIPTQMGWTSGDGTHYSDIGQSGHASILFSVLTN